LAKRVVAGSRLLLLPEGREGAALPTVVERLLDDFEALFVRTDCQTRFGGEPLPSVRSTLEVVSNQHAY
jgi:hypothetical protein